MSLENRIPPFGIKDKVGYLFGDLGNDFTFIFASSYLMVFYTKVLGISAAMVGVLFLTARCVDAFTDIGMGRLVDSAKTAKDGRFRCWLRRMCAPVALASFLMYQSSLADYSMTVKTIYMFVTYLLWGSIFYTSINIPYGSMASVVSDEPKDRQSLSVFRSLGASIASVAISVIAPLVVYISDENGNQIVSGSRFTLLAGIFSAGAVLCYLVCYFMTTERVKIDPYAKGKQEGLGTALKAVFTSRSLLAIILVAIFMLLGALMTQSISTYLFADYFKNTKALSINSMLGLPITILLALVAGKVAQRYGRKESTAAGSIFAAIMYLTAFVLWLRNVWAFVVVNFFATLGVFLFNMNIWAMITDVIDDNEVRTGMRDDGTIYGVYSFARKIGQALAGGLGGFALSAIGYDSLAAAQSESVTKSIYSLSTLFPAVIYGIVAIVLIIAYPLTKEKVNSNAEKLRRRREN